MNFNEYQTAAHQTAIYPSANGITYCSLGLCGEAGEVAEKVKKVIRDNDGVFSIEKENEVAKELGDVLWYVANLACELGFTLETIAEMNIEKLRSRQERSRLQGSGDDR